MAPLPSNNTGVLFLDYTTCTVEHTVQIRYASASSVGAAMTLLDDLLTSLVSGLTKLEVIGARHRAVGANVTFPIAWTGAASYGTVVGPRYKGAAYLDFVGRGITGRRLRIAIFGPGDFFDTANEDYRFTVADSAVVAAAVAVLEAGSAVPVDISGSEVTWNQYANTGVNAYWRNKIR